MLPYQYISTLSKPDYTLLSVNFSPGCTIAFIVIPTKLLGSVCFTSKARLSFTAENPLFDVAMLLARSSTEFRSLKYKILG